jgi:hypothetical protein
MRKMKSAMIGLLATITTAIASDSLAQFPGGGLPGGGSSRGGYPGGTRGGDRSRPESPREKPPIAQEDASDRVDSRLERLREDLQLLPSQQAAWKAYAESVTAFADDITRERTRDQPNTVQTPIERIDRMVEVARNRLTALEDIAAAAKALYSTLTPEQKESAATRVVTLIPAGGAGGPSSFPGRAQQPRGSP